MLPGAIQAVETTDDEVITEYEVLEDVEVDEIKEAPGGFGLFFRSIRENVSLALTFDTDKKSEKIRQTSKQKVDKRTSRVGAGFWWVLPAGGCCFWVSDFF